MYVLLVSPGAGSLCDGRIDAGRRFADRVVERKADAPHSLCQPTGGKARLTEGTSFRASRSQPSRLTAQDARRDRLLGCRCTFVVLQHQHPRHGLGRLLSVSPASCLTFCAVLSVSQLDWPRSPLALVHLFGPDASTHGLSRVPSADHVHGRALARWPLSGARFRGVPSLAHRPLPAAARRAKLPPCSLKARSSCAHALATLPTRHGAICDAPQPRPSFALLLPLVLRPSVFSDGCGLRLPHARCGSARARAP